MVMIAHWLQWQLKNEVLQKLPYVYGVTLFFVLSGFLITRILLKEKMAAEHNQAQGKSKLIKRFYMRRVLRIFPIYYLVILFLFAIDYQNIRELFPWLFSYAINIYQSITNEYIGEFNHFWSLAVEEQFYLFWPFLILWTPTRHLGKLIIGVIGGSLLWKAFIHGFGFNWMAHTYLTLGCMHALGIGALIAYLSLNKHPLIDRLAQKYVTAAGLIGYFVLWYALIYYRVDWYANVLDEFMFAVFAGILIINTTQRRLTGIAGYLLENKVVAYLGKISYGMYIFHLFMPSFYIFLSEITGFKIPEGQLIGFVTLFILTFTMAHFSWVLLEQPINRLKERFPYH